MTIEKPKPISYLIGPRKGAPSFDDWIALYRALTGKEPMPEDRAEAEAIYSQIGQDSQP